MIGDDVARQRIFFFKDARATQSAPLMRRGVGTALVFRGSPDRLRGRVGSHSPGVVERNSQVVAESGLPLTTDLPGILVALQGPFPGDIGRNSRPRRLRKCGSGTPAPSPKKTINRTVKPDSTRLYP